MVLQQFGEHFLNLLKVELADPLVDRVGNLGVGNLGVGNRHYRVGQSLPVDEVVVVDLVQVFVIGVPLEDLEDVIGALGVEGHVDEVDILPGDVEGGVDVIVAVVVVVIGAVPFVLFPVVAAEGKAEDVGGDVEDGEDSEAD